MITLPSPFRSTPVTIMTFQFVFFTDLRTSTGSVCGGTQETVLELLLFVRVKFRTRNAATLTLPRCPTAVDVGTASCGSTGRRRRTWGGTRWNLRVGLGTSVAGFRISVGFCGEADLVIRSEDSSVKDALKVNNSQLIFVLSSNENNVLFIKPSIHTTIPSLPAAGAYGSIIFL